jgi:hypothetical protein
MQNMLLSRTAQLTAALARLAEIGAQTGNDLYTLHVEWDTTHREWRIFALPGIPDNEAAGIDAVRAWAGAIDGGTVHLSDVEPYDIDGVTHLTRSLDCRGTLAGVSVEFHERLYDLGTPANAVPAAA